MTPTEEKILQWWKGEEAESYRKKLLSIESTCDIIRICVVPFFPAFDMLEYNRNTGEFKYLYQVATKGISQGWPGATEKGVVACDDAEEKELILP